MWFLKKKKRKNLSPEEIQAIVNEERQIALEKSERYSKENQKRMIADEELRKVGCEKIAINVSRKIASGKFDVTVMGHIKVTIFDPLGRVRHAEFKRILWDRGYLLKNMEYGHGDLWATLELEIRKKNY